MMKRLNQRGDTLIEVLLSLAIIGMVLGVAYGAASRSTRVGRLAQERTEALKQAESQIERMKAMTTQLNFGNLFVEPPSNSDFCVTVTVSGPPPFTLTKVASSDSGCRVGFYNIRNNYDSGTGLVTVTVTWEQQGGSSGGEQPEVVMLYKLYQ